MIAPEILGNEPGSYTWGYDRDQYAWATAIGEAFERPWALRGVRRAVRSGDPVA